MSDQTPEAAIVKALTEAASRHVVRKTIRSLHRLRITHDDQSLLKTVWDDICVQVQQQESLQWDAYDITVRTFLRTALEPIPRHEQEALWLQTDPGWD